MQATIENSTVVASKPVAVQKVTAAPASSKSTDFDANLADQTHRGAWHADWKLWFDANLPRGFNWAAWMQQRIEKPKVAPGTGSSFEESLTKLRAFLDGQTSGRKHKFTPLLTHSGDRDLYAFIERLISNGRQGLALPSQSERVCALGFNFGKAESAIEELLKHVVSDGYAQRRREMAPFLALPTKGELLEFEGNAAEERAEVKSLATESAEKPEAPVSAFASLSNALMGHMAAPRSARPSF